MSSGPADLLRPPALLGAPIVRSAVQEWGQEMAKLKSEIEVSCPCCRAVLVVDTNLRQVISHKEPEREDKPDLDAAQKILDEEKARREAIFAQSVESQKTRGDALARRFEEALRQAREEPVGPPPKRDFELD